MITGQCHCSNIQLSIPAPTDTGTRCTCSLCSRYGAIWGYFCESEVVVAVGPSGLSTYCQGDRLINFNRCNRCGCVTHYTAIEPTPDSRLAVNYRMFPASVTAKIRVRTFDGADSWRYLD